MSYYCGSRNPMTAMQGVEHLVGVFQAGMANMPRRSNGGSPYNTGVSLEAYERLEARYNELHATALAALEDARLELARKDAQLVLMRHLLKRRTRD